MRCVGHFVFIMVHIALSNILVSNTDVENSIYNSKLNIKRESDTLKYASVHVSTVPFVSVKPVYYEQLVTNQK